MNTIDYNYFYFQFNRRVEEARQLLGKPLTLAQKILAVHCLDIAAQDWERGVSTLVLQPDRVALQDATAQMSILQFRQAGRDTAAVPTTIHCDHLINAHVGAATDLASAQSVNQEVYDFLRSAAGRYGLGFHEPGSGIIHQVVLENHAFPGGLLIGTDSHTPNAGGLSMLSIGVGGADAAEVMGGLPYEVLCPKLLGVRLIGKLSPWTSPKDVITYLCTQLTVKGGTNKIIEYFGPGVASISAAGRATICNMGAELGATGSVFPMDAQSLDYLLATGRSGLASAVMANGSEIQADQAVQDSPESYFDEVITIDLDALRPWVVGPHSPDRGRALADLSAEASREAWPQTISRALIGSCTNSSFEDMTRAANLVQQATEAGLTLRTPLLISPGSDRIKKLMDQTGVTAIFERAGALVLANACGPCIGMWKRDDIGPNAANVIVSSFNRNFPGRNDGNSGTLSLITSPEIVVVLAFAGHLGFNPETDALTLAGGGEFRFKPPTSLTMPESGLPESDGLLAAAADPSSVEVIVSPTSDRLQLLQPFPAWDGQMVMAGLPILMKTRGKTTTDHISPAGPWLKYRGHLANISQNMLLGANNAFTEDPGTVIHPLTGEVGVKPHEAAHDLKDEGLRWVIFGDENYGEGSSREHAAMSPRFLGCAAVIVRSFARIHETNLKKQGILPLTFANPDDYDKVRYNDRVDIDLSSLALGMPIMLTLTHPDGTREEIETRHSMTSQQIGWFKAGSALNAAQQ